MYVTLEPSYSNALPTTLSLSRKHTVNVYKTEKEDVKDINYCLGIFFFVNSEISLWLALDGY